LGDVNANDLSDIQDQFAGICSKALRISDAALQRGYAALGRYFAQAYCLSMIFWQTAFSVFARSGSKIHAATQCMPAPLRAPRITLTDFSMANQSRADFVAGRTVIFANAFALRKRQRIA
jgi:hypothetical protein